MKLSNLPWILVLFATFGCAVTAVGQPKSWSPEPEAVGKRTYGTLNFETKLGSFKLLPKKDLASGRVEISFTGTLLLSNFKGTLTKTGSIRREYLGHDRQVYFGSGTIVVEGTFRGIQWFGRDMKGKWHGEGVARLFGEFDQSLDTGWFWYNDPTDRRAWGTYGRLAELPERSMIGTGTPVPRKRGGGSSPP
jgi:hypothetical protein